MKRLMISTIAMFVTAALAMPLMAQDRPPGPGPGGPGGPPPGGPGGFGPPGGPGGPGGGFGGPPGMGPGQMGPMGGPDRPIPPDMKKLQMLSGYIELVDRFARLSRDPTMAGVAAVVQASDMLRQRGTDTAIEYFNKIMPEVKNEAVQRAIRIQLVDLYKQSGQQDKALEQLDLLIKGAPAGAPAGSAADR